MSWFPGDCGLRRKYQTINMKCSLRFENDIVKPRQVCTDGKHIYFWMFFKYVWRKITIFNFLEHIDKEILYHFNNDHFIIHRGSVLAYFTNPPEVGMKPLLSKLAYLEKINRDLIKNAVDIVENIANTPLIIARLKFGFSMFIVGLIFGLAIQYIIEVL